MSSSYTVRRFTPELREDFFRIHDFGCYCVAWWVPTWEAWPGRTKAENLALRDELLERGEYDGYMLFAEEQPVGWCQVGPRDRLTKLVGTFDLEPDPTAWAISCFLIIEEHRRRGAASTLLAGVLADLSERGAKRVEAYPKRGEELDALELWNGPLRMYQQAGFRMERDATPRALLVKDLG